MPSFTIQRNKRYSAAIKLGIDQGHVPNSVIADKIHASGFADVSVRGSGRNRAAEGVWLQEDATIVVMRMQGTKPNDLIVLIKIGTDFSVSLSAQ